MKDIKAIAKLALATLVAGTSVSAMATMSTSDYIACYGVSKQGPNVPILISKGDCKKLAGSTAKPLTAAQQAQAAQMKPYTADDYAACYGVAAANMSDCATHSSACGGTAANPRDPNVWIAIPKGVCEQVKGGVVGNLSN